MKVVRRFLVVLLLALSALGGWLARGRLSGPHSAPADAGGTATATVFRGAMQQNIKARGIIKPSPNALVRLGFPMPKDVARRISKLPLVEGDAVEDGQVLAELDDADLQATLKQLAAEAKVAEDRLEGLRAMQPVETRVAEAARAASAAQLGHARRVFNRLSSLGKTSVVSTLERETAQNDFEVAQANLEQAEASLAQVGEKFQTDIAVLQSQVELAKAAVHNIEVQVRWSTLRSPLNGQVFAVHQHAGELTSNQPNSPVLTLLDPEQLQLHLYVDEADFGRIKQGQSVTFRVDAHPGETLKGSIVRLLPQPILQENVVYYLAVVEVVKEHRAPLRSEMTALAHIQAGVMENALWLPISAVRSRAEGWYVVPRGGAETPVTIGWKEDGRVEIVEGLKEGDQVLMEP